MKLYFRIEGKEGRSPEVLAQIKAKTKRRALRHFAPSGRINRKEVRHRVIAKDQHSITFGYFRRSGNPVRIRWRYELLITAKPINVISEAKPSTAKARAGKSKASPSRVKRPGGKRGSAEPRRAPRKGL